MRITLGVSGYYDWFPAPPGTEITEADVAAGLVKQMSDDKWYIRVERKARDGQHHDIGLHEAAICDRMAGLVAAGKPTSRAKAALDLIDHSNRAHLEEEHITSIEVHDDGPEPELYRTALVARGVAEERLDALVAKYESSTGTASRIKAALAPTEE